MPQGFGKTPEDGIGVGADYDVVSVAGGVGVRRCHEGQDGTRAAPDVAGERLLGYGALHEGEDGLVDPHVDYLAPAASRLAVVECCHGAEGAEGRSEGVAKAYANTRGRTIGVSRHVADPAHGLPDGPESGLVLVWTSLSVTRDPDHHEAGIDLSQVLIPQTPPFQRSRPEVFDDHVGFGDESAREVLALFFPQVEGDGLLVAGDDGPPEGVPVLAVAAPDPHGIPFARRF